MKVIGPGRITPENQPRWPWNVGVGGPQRGSGHFGVEKNFLPPQGFDTRVVQPTV